MTSDVNNTQCDQNTFILVASNPSNHLWQFIFNSGVVGEPKSRIVQKHTFFAPESYMAGILHTDIEIVLDMKPLYSNVTRIAFCGKMHFLYAT